MIEKSYGFGKCSKKPYWEIFQCFSDIPEKYSKTEILFLKDCHLNIGLPRALG